MRRHWPHPGSIPLELRSYLAQFLFSGEDVFKKVSALSGGEKSRLTLARIIYVAPQLLALDEKERLEREIDTLRLRQDALDAVPSRTTTTDARDDAMNRALIDALSAAVEREIASGKVPPERQPVLRSIVERMRRIVTRPASEMT